MPRFSSTLSLPTAHAQAPPPPVVRAVLAAARLAPGDRVLVHGPFAEVWDDALAFLGLQTEREPGAARSAAFEAAVWAGPADGSTKAHAAAVAGLVRPGRPSLAAGRADRLADLPPADAARLPDRVPGPTPFARSAGPGGWVLHTVPGAAVAAANPAAAPLAAAA